MDAQGLPLDQYRQF
ncbi:hypothetical protein [Paracoccus nototheniae]